MYSFLPISKLCDGIYDCHDGSDEFFCKSINCSIFDYCFCHSNYLKVDCFENIDFNDEIFDYFIYANLKKIKLFKNHIQNKTNIRILNLKISQTKTLILKRISINFQNLVLLNLSGNFLETFKSIDFISNKILLQTLDLSNNLLKYLDKSSFYELKNLFSLILNENYIKKIESYTFFHLFFLNELQISKNYERIKLHKDSLHNLNKLLVLDISSSELYDTHVSRSIFRHLSYLQNAYFKTNRYCCYLKRNKINSTCDFNINEMKYCKDISINIFEIILLLFYLFFFIFLFIIDLFIFKILKTKNIINLVLNLFTIFYIFLLILHFLLRQIVEWNNDALEYEIFDFISTNFTCKIFHIFYQFFSVFCLCSNFIEFYQKISKKYFKIILIFTLPTLITILTIIIQVFFHIDCSILIFYFISTSFFELQIYFLFFSLCIQTLLSFFSITFFCLIIISKNSKSLTLQEIKLCFIGMLNICLAIYGELS